MKNPAFSVLFSLYFVLMMLFAIGAFVDAQLPRSGGRLRSAVSPGKLQITRVVTKAAPPTIPRFVPSSDEYDPIFVNKVQNFTLCEDASVYGSPRPEALPHYTLAAGTPVKSHDWFNGFVMIEPAYWILVSTLCGPE